MHRYSANRETPVLQPTQPANTRLEVAERLFRSLSQGLGPSGGGAQHDDWDDIDEIVPHAQLRLALLSDPALAAIIADSGCLFAPGDFTDAPFRLGARGVVMLPAALMSDPAALAAAARWAMEARRLSTQSAPEAALLRSAAFASALVAMLPAASAGQFYGVVPKAFHHELSQYTATLSAPFMSWLAVLLAIDPPAPGAVAVAVEECDLPLERVMVGGGDSRLVIASDTRRNKYGVPPHPRPAAVHFSSSTASAVSDHGFLLCERLRRQIQFARDTNANAGEHLARQCLLDNIASQLLALLGLSSDEASLCVSSSGTDTELMAVLLASQSEAGSKIENILVAPDESGRGVRLAAAGQFFDAETATGHAVMKGGLAWAGEPVAVHEIEIRNARGEPRQSRAIGEELHSIGKAILDRGNSIVMHVLLASKTGLLAPDYDYVDELTALAPGRVEVIVDACQMRVPFDHLGELVRKGWLVQISGSKFLTGPPFSGALVVPAALRARAARLNEALCKAPAVGHPSDWDSTWSGARVADTTNQTSGFGPLFRWVPAVAEAMLFRNLAEATKAALFERFRSEILARIEQSPALRPIAGEKYFVPEGNRSFMTNTILSFEILANDGAGGRVALAEPACRKIFEYLNEDMRTALPHLNPIAMTIAGLQAHLGQPVALGSEAEGICVLRMVLGARFFNFVGHCPPQSQEAALISEIEDAKRAISKLELLADNWPQLRDLRA